MVGFVMEGHIYTHSLVVALVIDITQVSLENCDGESMKKNEARRHTEPSLVYEYSIMQRVQGMPVMTVQWLLRHRIYHHSNEVLNIIIALSTQRI